MSQRRANSAIFTLIRPVAATAKVNATIDGCDKIETLNGYRYIGKTYYEPIPASSTKCYAIETAFLFGDNLKITPYFYSTTKNQYFAEEASSSFVGISTHGDINELEDHDVTVGPEYPTIIKVENTASSEKDFYIVIAIPSVEIEGAEQRSYFATYGFTWKVNMAEDKSKNTFVETIPIVLGGSGKVKWSGNNGNFICEPQSEIAGWTEATGHVEVTAQKVAVAFAIAAGQKVGEQAKSGELKINETSSCYVLPKEDKESYDISTSTSWSFDGQPKFVPPFFGAIKNENKVLTKWNLVGPRDLPIWGYLVALLVIIVVFLLIVIAIIVCYVKKCKKGGKKKGKKGKKSSSTSSSSFS